MKKIGTILCIMVVLLLLLCGCGECDHEYSETITQKPSCTEVGIKTFVCNDCNESYTEEIPIVDHIYNAATCTDPETCKTCGTTEGTAKGHNWEEATCLTPKTCKVCGTTEGDAKGHNWESATCLAPKTCLDCLITDGEVTDHDYKDDICTVCGKEDPKLQQIFTADLAFTFLQAAEVSCDIISDKISSAWYFAIYRDDSHYDGDEEIAGFSKWVGLEESLVRKGVDSCINLWGGEVSSWARAKVLHNNDGALYVVAYVLGNQGLDFFNTVQESIDFAKEDIGALDTAYESVNARTELLDYYNAVCAYFEFCCSPTGSFSTLSSTLSSLRTSCATNRTYCSFYFE